MLSHMRRIARNKGQKERSWAHGSKVCSGPPNSSSFLRLFQPALPLRLGVGGRRGAPVVFTHSAQQTNSQNALDFQNPVKLSQSGSDILDRMRERRRGGCEAALGRNTPDRGLGQGHSAVVTYEASDVGPGSRGCAPGCVCARLACPVALLRGGVSRRGRRVEPLQQEFCGSAGVCVPRSRDREFQPSADPARPTRRGSSWPVFADTVETQFRVPWRRISGRSMRWPC
jgi:hypothetical protein